MKFSLKPFIFTIVGIAVAMSMVSCKNTSKKTLLPNVSGKAGEVIVVLDKGDWEGNLGTAVRELLASDCPWLAQKEPLYSLVNVVPSGFVNLFKVHRNIVYFDINPQVATEGITYRTDVWSHPQCVIEVKAATAEKAESMLATDGNMILNAIEQAERDRVIGNTLLYEEKEIAPKVAESFGGSPHFPTGYKLKKITSDFAWVAYEKQYSMQGIFLYSYPAAGDATDFSDATVVSQRNAALQANVPGMFENTYMTTSEFIAPTITFMRYKERDFANTRGFWEVYNDYMGGPFVSHSFYSKDGSKVIVAEAFVYAPRFDKRQLLRQTESILYSFEWTSEENLAK